MLARTSPWVHALGAIFGALVAAPLLLSLMACKPQEPPGTPGVNGMLLFRFTQFGLVDRVTLAADGAMATLTLVPADRTLTFTSSDPSIIEITPTGELVTGAPGTVDLIASDGDGEVDRVSVSVVRAVRIEVRRAGSRTSEMVDRMLPDFEQTLVLTRHDADGASLAGLGGWEATATGSLAVRPVNEDDVFGGEDFSHDFVVVSSVAVGSGSLIITTGEVTSTTDVTVLSVDEVDEIRELRRWRAGGGAGTAAVRLDVQAFAGGDVVGGARCRWSVEGATIGLDGLQPDGSLSTDFWTETDSFVAHCEIGAVAHDFEVVIAEL